MLLIAAGFTGLLNITIETVAYRPLRGAPRLAPLITAIGVSFILQNVGLRWKGPAPVSIRDDILPQGKIFTIGDADFGWDQLIVFADEIYDKTLYDGVTHTSIAALADDVLFVTFNGLSKNYRACGYRSGWMVLSGDKRHAQDYIEGLNILASMRLCANVPGQFAIQTALGGYQSINDLVAPGGRLTRQRDLAYNLITSIPGVTCVKPQAALYLFPKLDLRPYPIADDQQFILELLEDQKVLVVQGSGFNWPNPDHFRIVFLPNSDDLTDAIGRIASFLEHYRNRHARQAA
jgi:alanine-synthesizing transaminase